MLDATPTVFFMHFYATGDALSFAQGLRAGLESIAANPPAQGYPRILPEKTREIQGLPRPFGRQWPHCLGKKLTPG